MGPLATLKRTLAVDAYKPWFGYLAATAAVAFMTLLIGLILGYLPRTANLSMLNLISVLAVAVGFGRGPAIFAAVLSFLLFNWFFVQPTHTFTIADPNEWVVLFVFLITAVTTGQLAAGQRQRAEEAERRERETALLYDTARLLGEPRLEEALESVAERLRQELALPAVAVELQDDNGKGMLTTTGDSRLLKPSAQRGSGLLEMFFPGPAPSGTQRGKPGRWVRVVPPQIADLSSLRGGVKTQVIPIKVEQRIVGQIVLARAGDDGRHGPAVDRLVAAVANQIGLAVERNRLRREATETEILRRTDELKTALLHAVSHDLRTPLASIIASAGSLRRKDVQWSEEDREEFAAAIEEESTRLNRIVGNLLDLSRVEAGTLAPERDWYDLGALVDDVVGRLRSLTAGHAVAVDVPEDLPPVYMDYVEIDQVLSNIIENAAKYSSPDGAIEVSASRVGDEIQVAVTDSGEGISPEALPHLFERFFRAGREGRRPEGTGLGLAVARGLVEAHGGRIWAENRPGGGARFVFTLPLPESTRAEAASEEADR